MANTFTLWGLLNNRKVIVPLIQRDYAQGRKGKEYIRSSFLSEIEGHLQQGTELTLDFVYGNTENDAFHPLDGQQRLTTLWLVHWFVAYKTGQLKNVKNILERFSYETRITARDFCYELCEKMADVPICQEGRLASFIKEQSWFFSDWMQDPTINSMLRTISGDVDAHSNDNIEDIFISKDLELCWTNLTQKNIITFELMIIGSEKLPISDDLYIKMNARGKKLTDFENFKADWVSHIQNDDAFSTPYILDERKLLNQYYPEQIDNAWTDVFWNSAKKSLSFNGNIDDIFFSFLNRYVLNHICLNRDFVASHYDSSKHTSADNPQIIDIQNKFNKLYGVGLGAKKNSNDDSLIAYEGFDLYRESLTLEQHKTLDNILSKLSDSQIIEKLKNIRISDFDKEDDSEIDGNASSSEEFAFIPQRTQDGRLKATKQKERIYFHALCKFLENPVLEQFDNWVRIVKNLIENAAVEGIESMITCLRLIDEVGIFLSNNEWKVYEFLPQLTPKSISNNSRLGLQWAEEQEKARKIHIDPSIEALIREAESYCFFNGTIRFLYTDGNGNINWDEFPSKFDVAKLRFKDNNMVSSNSVKLFLSMFENFDELGTDSYYFTTKGYHPRNKCWKTTILCNPYLVAQVHNFLQDSPCSRATGLYNEFINSGSVEVICSQSDSYKYRYHWSRSYAVHRDYSQTAGLYVYDGRLDKNAIIEALNNAGIIELFEENKFYGRFLWGTEVWFRCNSKEYLWIVDWNGKDIIQMKDVPLRTFEWTNQNYSDLSAWLQAI